MIDQDQGKTAAGSAAAHGRDGFAELVSAVGLGQVGLVLILEVSGLARNPAEWLSLIELCALCGTLIADDTTIYDPRLFNDWLLLGLRGTISEVELHFIKARLDGARMSAYSRSFGHLIPQSFGRAFHGIWPSIPDELAILRWRTSQAAA